MFEYTGVTVMASEDGTVIDIDTDGNGVTDITTTLNEGESYLVNGGLVPGATITTSQPVQVDLITGDICGTYELREYIKKCRAGMIMRPPWFLEKKKIISRIKGFFGG